MSSQGESVVAFFFVVCNNTRIMPKEMSTFILH